MYHVKTIIEGPTLSMTMKIKLTQQALGMVDASNDYLKLNQISIYKALIKREKMYYIKRN